MGNTISGTDGRERGGKHRKLPSFGLFLNRSSPGGSRLNERKVDIQQK